MLRKSGSSPIGVDNMIMLDNLTEETLLTNLEVRHKQLQIYTYIGSILVALNPYRELPIYGSDALTKYSTETNKAVLPPHIFAIADNAYVRMVEEERNQSILISGESGSGKSESTKLILRYLASRNGRHSKIEQMLVEISPILESFGNAKTSQNDNSSRFGKFIEIYFGTEKQGLVGAKIVTYLLEKSRIVQQGENERNYHVFYQFIQGASEAERKMYRLQLPQEFNYLNQGNCYTIAGVSDAEEFTSLKSGFRFLGFDDQMQSNIFSILAAILHLGNVKFVKGEKDEVKIANPEVSSFVASMLKLQPEQLNKALCTRKMSVKGSAAVVIPLQLQEANTSRESFAKTLYSQLFAWIVKTINLKIDPPTAESSIGILDIFGFECFQKNSFEQLCINFANEKLAQYFNSYIFKQEQEEYKSQKIDWKNVEFVDNEECVNLIEKKPLGIIGILDEECRFPQATDLTFLDKLVKNLSKHPHFEVPKMTKNQFAVNHYAGKVNYTVDGMLEKNRDLVSDDLIEICSHPSAGFTREIMQLSAQPETPVNPRELTGTMGRKGGAAANTVGAQFKQQLNELVKALAATTPSFVRCVKPNPTKTPGGFDRTMVVTQLKYSGMLETVRIRKAGFGARMTFIDFYDRYKCLCAKMIGKEKVSDEIMCDYLSKALAKMKILDDNGFQKGRTKIFLRDAQVARLEEVRVKIYIQKCIIIQKYWKMYSTRKYFKLLRASTIKIQACFRGYRARKRNPLAWKRKQVIKIQTLIRRAMCRRKYLGIIAIVRKKAEDDAKKRKEEQKMVEDKRAAELKSKAAPSSPSSSPAASPVSAPRMDQSPNRPLAASASAGSIPKFSNQASSSSPAPLSAPAAQQQSQFKQIRKESSLQQLPLNGLSADSTPALRALARESSPHSPSDPPSSGLMLTMHRRKETVMNETAKTMPNLSVTAKQKMFTPTSSESALPIPSGGTLRRLGESTGITQKVATLHRTHTSSMPTAPIYVRTNSMTGLASTFSDVQPILKSKNAEPPPILKPEEVSCYTWAQFFVGFCNKETGDFSTKIQSHLLKTSSAYSKVCVQMFDYILELMGDSMSKKSKINNAMQPFLTAQNLTEIGIKCPDLIDEIFAMICKQITNNPNSASVEKGWELMAICSCTFSPSASTIRYILAKVLSHKGDRANFWPDFCAKNLQRNHFAPIRKFVPSIQEISAIKNCSKIKINVAFMAGKHFPVEIESHTTCADVCGVIEGAFNVKNTSHYTVYEVFGELERAISYGERMCDIVAKWELYQTSISSKGLNANFAFYYKRHLFPHPTLEIHDEVDALFTYHQAIFGVLHDHYPLSEDLVLTLAALQICNEPKVEMRKCIPKNWFKNHELGEWDKMINSKSNFLGLRGFNPAMARQVYLQYMTQVPLFGSTSFSVKETDPPRASVVIAINIYGLHVCEPSTKEWLRSYSFTQMERWGNTESTFFFRLETDPPTSFSFDTIQGAEICATLGRHCAGLMDATHARAIMDFVGAIQFQTGDLIKITGKDISPGWYTGTTNSKTGLFPLSSVQLGYADLPPLDATGNFNLQKKTQKEVAKPTSHNTYAPKPMKEVDAEKFPFSKFAASNFRTQSTKKTVKSLDATARTSYSKYPLEESLLRLSAEFNSIAISVFDKILKYISETHFTKSIVRVAQDIVQTGIDKMDLRDEIYCQLIKQATLNPNSVSFKHVWELLAFCSCCFMPSENLVDYMLAYFQVNTGWQSDARHLAVDCLRKLQFTLQYGDRVVAPSIWEMQFIMRNQPMVCGVLLPDRTTMEIPIESSTNAEDLLSRVAEKMKIPLDDFQEFYLYTFVPEKKSGFKATPAAWRSVKSTRKVADMWGAAEKLQLLGGDQPPALKIRRKFVIGAWPSTVISPNPFYCQLEFGQAFEEFVEGKIACTPGEAIVFSVLGLQVLHGDYDVRHKIVTTKTIYDYMPKFILEDGGNISSWVDKIHLAHQQLAGKHLSETRTKFLSRMRAWKLYGSSIFKVEQRKKPYVLWMAINQKGVDFLEFPKLQPIAQYTFTQILSWNFSKEGEFNLLTGSLQNPTKEYFTASECQEIAELLDTYLQMHLKTEEAKYKSKNMEKSAFSTAKTFKTPSSQRGSRNSRLSIPKPRNSAQISAGKRNSKILFSPDDLAPPSAQVRTPAASPHSSIAPRGAAPTGAFAKPAARVANPRSSAASMRFNFKK